VPEGQFGTRLNGGKDAASPRYIFSMASQLTRLIYREDDLPILNYITDDGISVEPEYYIPIIPMILVNGGIGIGTGFSTNIPCHNPEEIIKLCEYIARTDADIDGMEFPAAMVPWYLGFKGTIVLHKPGVYQSRGVWRWVDDTTVEITELPIGTWTDDYKEFLTELLAAGSPVLKDFETHCSAKNVRFILKMYPGVRAAIEPTFETDYKLVSTSNLSLNNIHLFGENGAVNKFQDSGEVVKAWAKVRLQKYAERKRHQLATMEYEHTIVSAKVRFIQEIIDKTLNVMNVKMADLESQLKKKGYPTEKRGDAEAEADAAADADNGGYKYLTRMPIHQLTAEKKAELERQARDLSMRIDALRARPITDIWLTELAELKEAWLAYRADIEAEYEADKCADPASSKVKAKAKRVAKK
jgi:DNA topoisomerase-2